MMQVNEYTETDFKETEIGLIPIEWDVELLDEICEEHKQTVNPNDHNAIPYVGLEHITPGTPRITAWGDSSEVTSSKTFFRSGHILYGKLRPYLDKAAVAPFEGICSTDIVVLNVCEGKTTPDFLVNLLHTNDFLAFATSTMTGVNHPRTHWSSLKRHPIALPPVPEQRRIAAVLNAIQDEIATQDDLIAEAKEFKRSLMQRLFTYGVGSERAETKDTDIGEIPAHWDVVELEQLADIDYGIQAAVAHMTEESMGIPILTNVNIKLDGNLDLSLLRYYPLPNNKHDKILRHGDVLFNWRSGSEKHVGKTAIFDVPGEFTFSSFILRFRTKGHVSNGYLAHFMHYLRESGQFLTKRGQSSVNSVLNASAAAKLLVAHPSVDTEQAEIVQLLNDATLKIAAEEDRRVALQDFFQTMLHQLMTGQIRLLSDDGLPL